MKSASRCLLLIFGPCSSLAWAAPAEARFLQVDPVGYKDQFNLYAYVGDDPVNRGDPTGMMCTAVGVQRGGATEYACRIDQVAIVDRRGHVVGTRDPTANENRRFISFNARYTAAVNRLARNPDTPATVAAIRNGQGSFETTAGQAAAALVSRQFIYTDRASSGRAMITPGGPGIAGDEQPRSYVFRDGLGVSGSRIVHEGGLHGTPEEARGGLQTNRYPLARWNHQSQYDDAACGLLGGQDC